MIARGHIGQGGERAYRFFSRTSLATLVSTSRACTFHFKFLRSLLEKATPPIGSLDGLASYVLRHSGSNFFCFNVIANHLRVFAAATHDLQVDHSRP
jgi:hypothetical protein